jgi:hypothetical protein
MNRLADRAAAGLLKYGTDTTRADLTRAQWLRHAQEEALDFAVYLERLIEDDQRELAKPEPEPIFWAFQHDETGRVTCVDSGQIEDGFEKRNPRWQKICPLYRKKDL